jgi:hypothetical protein
LIRGSLPAASWVLTDRIVTLNASLVVKTFGRVPEGIVAEAIERFCGRIASR